MRYYFKTNKLTLLMVISAIIIGIVIGASSVVRLDTNVAAELYSAVNESVKNTTLSRAFIKSLFNEFKKFLMLFLCGLTIFGSPLSVFYVGFTGYTLGFSVAFLLKYYGMAGVFAAIFGVVPHYLLLLPACCFAGVMGINFSNKILMKHNEISFELRLYLTKMFLITLIIFFACLIEGYLSSLFLKKIFNLI